jgi:hypothetical protein
MPLTSPIYQDVTTINYTLTWPHLENPSNTTFAGPTQIDICRCGSTNTDLGHIYTRYSCPRPEISFASPNDELWVLQAPLGQINLLRPATEEEFERRREVRDGAEPSAYAGKNFLLLSGPCPRGRYQAFATLQFLRSLSSEARQHVEYISLLIQPYEEDCCDDQGGRAYMALARYIVKYLPAFKSLYLNIWGEATRLGSRDFAMLLWEEGVTVVISWDWWGESAEEYTDVDAFLEGIENGVVVKRPIWDDFSRTDGNEPEGEENDVRVIESDVQEISQDDQSAVGTSNVHGEQSKHEQEQDEYAGDGDGGINSVDDVTIQTSEQECSDDEWSETMWTPLSPTGGSVEDGWQVL